MQRHTDALSTSAGHEIFVVGARAQMVMETWRRKRMAVGNIRAARREATASTAETTPEGERRGRRRRRLRLPSRRLNKRWWSALHGSRRSRSFEPLLLSIGLGRERGGMEWDRIAHASVPPPSYPATTTTVSFSACWCLHCCSLMISFFSPSFPCRPLFALVLLVSWFPRRCTGGLLQLESLHEACSCLPHSASSLPVCLAPSLCISSCVIFVCH